MKKSKKLVYIDNFKEEGELLQCLLARIINEVPLCNNLKNSYLPRL